MTPHEMMDMTPNPDRLAIELRMPSQRILAELMLGENFEKKSRSEKFPLEMEWANKYLKRISDIIDNPENTEVRELIFAGEHEKAAQYLKSIFESEKAQERPEAA